MHTNTTFDKRLLTTYNNFINTHTHTHTHIHTYTHVYTHGHTHAHTHTHAFSYVLKDCEIEAKAKSKNYTVLGNGCRIGHKGKPHG